MSRTKGAMAWVVTPDRVLRSTSRLAVLAWTAHAHWALAGWLGMPTALRWALPVAVDAYVLAAIRSRRRADLAWALALDVAAVSGSLALTATGHHNLAHDRAIVGALLGSLLVLVLWRVDVLVAHAGQAVTPTVTPVTLVAETGVTTPEGAAVTPTVTPVAAAADPRPTTRATIPIDPPAVAPDTAGATTPDQRAAWVLAQPTWPTNEDVMAHFACSESTAKRIRRAAEVTR